MNSKTLALVIFLLLFTCLTSQVVVAANLKLTWTYTEDVPKITGFKVYSGPKSFPDAKKPTTGSVPGANLAAPYEQVVEVTDVNARQWLFTVAFPGSRFLRMTTYKKNTDGTIAESPFSMEVGIATVPNPPSGLVIGE